MAPDERLFVVTTRSRLKSARFFPSMMVASMRIRRQLKATGEVVSWASIVAGPTEFWTITAWKSRHEMQEFMRSGAHDEIMWNFAKWLRSFWLMRWRPCALELGAWRGATFAGAAPDFAGAAPDFAGAAPGDPGPDAHGTAAEGAPEDAAAEDAAAGAERRRRELLAQALEHFPRLKAATGADGAATYDNTPFARRRRSEVGGAGGAVVHIATTLAQTPGALRALRALRRQADSHGGLLRSAVGVSRPGEVYLLALWKDHDGPAELLGSPEVKELAERWPDGFWANMWVPENEFGHWDGLRLRRSRGRYAITMRPEEQALGESPDAAWPDEPRPEEPDVAPLL